MEYYILTMIKYYVEQIISYFWFKDDETLKDNDLSRKSFDIWFKDDEILKDKDLSRKSFDIWLPKNNEQPIFDREYNLLF